MSDAISQPHEEPPEKNGFGMLYFEEFLATAALAVVVASVSWGVLTRYLMPQPANWTTELSAIGFAWAVFLGSASAFRRGGHIMIDTGLTVLPQPIARLLRMLAGAITLATLATISLLAIRFTLSTTDIPTTILRLPQAVIYGAAATGFSLMTLRHLAWCVESFRKARNNT